MSNAGITNDGLLLRMSEDDFTVGDRRQPHRRLPGHQAGRPRACCGRATGRIILMSSVVALLGSAGQANYAASKAGLVGLARSLARELGSRCDHRQRRRARARRDRHDRGARATKRSPS